MCHIDTADDILQFFIVKERRDTVHLELELNESFQDALYMLMCVHYTYNIVYKTSQKMFYVFVEEFCIGVQKTSKYRKCTGLRDDLTFLLEEELSSINLCSLHCEMRNCEQLLGSLGLVAYHMGSQDELNKALSDHGPESRKGLPRVFLKRHITLLCADILWYCASCLGDPIAESTRDGETLADILRSLEFNPPLDVLADYFDQSTKVRVQSTVAESVTTEPESLVYDPPVQPTFDESTIEGPTPQPVGVDYQLPTFQIVEGASERGKRKLINS
ncbi:hypothetical protein ACROYT_G014441 [Oculina patagonica]